MFYDRFLELCDKKGIKPTNACIEAGLSRGLAAKWKATGTEKPSADALEKMSVYFGVSIDEILGGQKETAPTLTKKDEEYTEKEKRVIDCYRNKPELQPAVDILLGVDDSIC